MRAGRDWRGRAGHHVGGVTGRVRDAVRGPCVTRPALARSFFRQTRMREVVARKTHNGRNGGRACRGGTWGGAHRRGASGRVERRGWRGICDPRGRFSPTRRSFASTVGATANGSPPLVDGDARGSVCKVAHPRGADNKIVTECGERLRAAPLCGGCADGRVAPAPGRVKCRRGGLFPGPPKTSPERSVEKAGGRGGRPPGVSIDPSTDGAQNSDVLH